MRLSRWLQSAAIVTLSFGVAHAQSITTSSVSDSSTVTYASTQPIATSPSSTITNTAATYATFQGDITNVKSRPLSSKSDIEQNLDALGGQNTGQLTSGWMSYSALIAAQNREFANSVREVEAYYGREVLVNALRKAPSYATSLKGGDRALQSSLAAAAADSMYISSAASFLESQESNLQNQSWVKDRIRDGSERASRLKSMTYSGRPISQSARDLLSSSNIGNIVAQSGQYNAWERAARIATNAPVAAISSLTQRTYHVNPVRSETANHMASLAAYEIIGGTSLSDPGVVNAMNDRRSKDCFEFAQQQFNQCVGTQSDHYGLQACMRKHAISDMGKCVGSVAQ